MMGWAAAKQGKLKVVLFLAGRSVGLDALLQKSCDPGKSYEIVGALLTTPESQAIPTLDTWGIPWRCHDIHDFYHRQGVKVSDLSLRREFDRRSLELISDFRPSCLALYGYIYILSPVALEAFPLRIVNIHDSDLNILDSGGKPKYRGLHSTRDAILAGETSTSSTVHLATEELDAGPILVRSAPYPVYSELIKKALAWGAMDILKAYAYAHRAWMMRDSWAPLMDTALDLMAQERVYMQYGRIFVDASLRPSETPARPSELLYPWQSGR
jgi:phosphoribosylglycinamide formyltransferase-1